MRLPTWQKAVRIFPNLDKRWINTIWKKARQVGRCLQPFPQRHPGLIPNQALVCLYRDQGSFGTVGSGVMLQ